MARSYRRARLRLLLLASLCFAGLAANNVLLFVDLILVPQIDLSIPRALVALTALLFFVVGLVLDFPRVPGTAPGHANAALSVARLAAGQSGPRD